MFENIYDEINFPFEDYYDCSISFENILVFKTPIYLYHITNDNERFKNNFNRNKRTSFAPSIIQCIIGMGYYDVDFIASIYRTKHKVDEFYFPDFEPDYMMTQECVLYNKIDFNDLICISEDIKIQFDVSKSSIYPIIHDNLVNNIYYPNLGNRADKRLYKQQVEEYRDLLDYQNDIQIINQLINCPKEQKIHENNWTNKYREFYL